MKKDIYHYYFEYDKGLIEVVKEQYTDEDPSQFKFAEYKYGKGNFIIVYTRAENNHGKVYAKSDVGTVLGGKFILLYERDDEKARQIMLNYLETDIFKQYEKLTRYIDKYDQFSQLEISEGIYDKTMEGR